MGEGERQTAVAVTAQIPDAFEFMFGDERYLVAFGGRGSAKSESIARVLLLLAAREKHRILCARELQASIKDSVHKLLATLIDEMGLSGFYSVQETVIRGANGSEFIFKGLRHNISEVKSLFGVTKCWVEEAQMVSKASWDVLLPTIRAAGSQFYISFNPLLETDDTYKRFVLNPPPDAVVRKVNWNENPFFPPELRAQMEHLKEVDPDAHLQVWEGHTRVTLDGAVFANELRAAISAEPKRITRVPYDPGHPVIPVFDLGRRDLTAIWFAQQVGFEHRLIDYYENRGHHIAHYLKVLSDRPYHYGEVWLPHDASNAQLGAVRTIEQQVRDAGHRTRIVPKVAIVNRINAARSLFPRAFFDETACAQGLMRLRNYRYEVDEETGQWSANPLHDDNSNGADAFTYYAVALQEPKRAAPPCPASRPRRRFMAA